MKAEDLGINPKTGFHNRNLTRVENKFLGILWNDHQGDQNKISADELAIRFDYALSGRDISDGLVNTLLVNFKNSRQNYLEERKRDVRYLHNHLLVHHDQVPILSRAGSGGGYWIAENQAEAEAFYDSFRKRGMTGLVKASRGKKAILVDMMKQLSFEFEELSDRTGFSFPPERIAGMPAPIEVVDAFLERMLKDPAKFADGLRKIGKKYGSVLLPKGQVEALTAKAAELQEIVRSLSA